MQELIEENACLEFEKANMKEGYKGGLRRMLSSSSELFSGSQLQIAGMHLLILYTPLEKTMLGSGASHIPWGKILLAGVISLKLPLFNFCPPPPPTDGR